MSHEQALEAAPNLTSLSLSHNALRQIALPRGALPLLVELNINKNALASLTFLEVRPLSCHLARPCGACAAVCLLADDLCTFPDAIATPARAPLPTLSSRACSVAPRYSGSMPQTTALPMCRPWRPAHLFPLWASTATSSRTLRKPLRYRGGEMKRKKEVSVEGIRVGI